ncbi:SPX domain-domain containing protein [Rhodotorula toruloides]|uniref:SPX domain-domain containing protein n=1 Tax=Rhodotorula toruloides TaxID=5286 RepID=A0A2S9ZVK9_RHOTO|nr:SPX domain-domain containing protein [Rhodotorula toruloides]
MKFGRYLAAHQIDEWKRAYIDYRKLKKQIGRAEEELFDIDSGGIGETGEAGEDVRETAQDDERRAGSARRLQRQTSSSAAPEAVEEDGVAEAANGRDLERGSSENDDDDEPTSPSSHNKRSQNSSSRAVKSRQSQPPASTPPHSPGLSSSSHEHVSDTTQNTDRPLVTRKESSKSGISLKQQTSEQPLTQRHTRRFSTSKPAQGPRGQDGRWRKGLKSNMELSEVYERIPPQCRRFFTLLDRELERVTSFYADRETEATKRFEQLDAQWKELANHKKEFQAFRERELHPPQFVTSILPKRGHLPNVPGSHLVRRTLAHRRRQLADAAHMGNGDQPERRLSGESEDSHERGGDEHAGDADDEGTAREQVFKQVRPEDYTNARSKLKLATFEYYRYLGMLKSYRVLNRTGFAKALKKYEKATQIPCAVKYSEKVEKANFVASTKLDDLIRETENAFANVFERGDRKKALERLRDFGEKKRHHFSTWRAGMFMGAGLPLMIEGLVLSVDSPRDSVLASPSAAFRRLLPARLLLARLLPQPRNLELRSHQLRSHLRARRPDEARLPSVPRAPGRPLLHPLPLLLGGLEQLLAGPDRALRLPSRLDCLYASHHAQPLPHPLPRRSMVAPPVLLPHDHLRPRRSRVPRLLPRRRVQQHLLLGLQPRLPLLHVQPRVGAECPTDVLDQQDVDLGRSRKSAAVLASRTEHPPLRRLGRHVPAPPQRRQVLDDDPVLLLLLLLAHPGSSTFRRAPHLPFSHTSSPSPKLVAASCGTPFVSKPSTSATATVSASRGKSACRTSRHHHRKRAAASLTTALPTRTSTSRTASASSSSSTPSTPASPRTSSPSSMRSRRRLSSRSVVASTTPNGRLARLWRRSAATTLRRSARTSDVWPLASARDEAHSVLTRRAAAPRSPTTMTRERKANNDASMGARPVRAPALDPAATWKRRTPRRELTRRGWTRRSARRTGRSMTHGRCGRTKATTIRRTTTSLSRRVCGMSSR